MPRHTALCNFFALAFAAVAAAVFMIAANADACGGQTGSDLTDAADSKRPCAVTACLLRSGRPERTTSATAAVDPASGRS